MIGRISEMNQLEKMYLSARFEFMEEGELGKQLFCRNFPISIKLYFFLHKRKMML